MNSGKGTYLTWARWRVLPLLLAMLYNLLYCWVGMNIVGYNSSRGLCLPLVSDLTNARVVTISARKAARRDDRQYDVIIWIVRAGR